MTSRTASASPGVADGAREWPIYATAFVLLCLITLHVFVMVEPVKTDVGGFVSPILEYVHTGRVVYPAHGPDHADAMIVHPPTYYWLTGLLMRAGLPLFAALGTLVLVMTVLAFVAVLRAPFPPELKLGLLIGLYVPNFVLIDLDAIRPELQMALGWVAGLVLLESARLRGWKPWPLAFGSFLICYSCSLHYFAWPGAAALAVYALWAFLTTRTHRAHAIRAIVAGASVYLVPFVVLFVYPEREGIVAIITALKPLAVTGTAAAPGAFTYHRLTYESSYSYLATVSEFRSLFRVLAAPSMLLGIPAVAIAYPLLYRWREARVLACAALAVLVPLLVVVTHKSLPYYRMELTLMYAALIAVAVGGVTAIARRVGVHSRVAMLGAAAVLVALCLLDFRGWSAVSGHRFVDEIALQRVISRQVLGTDALVGGRSVTQWFTSGGAAYRFVTTDTIYPADVSAIGADYFSEFDAIAEEPAGSWVTYNKQRKTLSSYYLDGVLHLALVYFGRPTRATPNDYYLSSPRSLGPRRAVFWRGDSLVLFRERSGGASALLAAEVRGAAAVEHLRRVGDAVSLYLLPSSDDTYLAFIVGNATAIQQAKLTCPACSPRDFIEGDFQVVDPASLLADFDYRRERTVVVHTRPEAMPFRMVRVSASPSTSMSFEPSPTGVELSESGAQRGFETVSPVGSSLLATTPAMSIDPSAWYEVKVTIGIRSGKVLLFAVDPSRDNAVLARLDRFHARPDTEERFAVGGGQSLQIRLVAANGPPAHTAVTAGRVTVQRVAPKP